MGWGVRVRGWDDQGMGVGEIVWIRERNKLEMLLNNLFLLLLSFFLFLRNSFLLSIEN